MTDKFVYFVRPIGMYGPVKIGCSESPATRVDGLMAWSPFPLEVIVTFPGGYDVERRFHARFAGHHSHREWFHATPEIYDVIGRIQNGSFSLDELPIPKRGALPYKRIWSPEDRETMGLIIRMSRLTTDIGMNPRDYVRDAKARLYKVRGDERIATIAIIEDYIRDPLSHGDPYPYDWAKPKFAAYLAKRAA